MNRNIFMRILSGDNRGVLGINRRNLGYVYPDNTRKNFRLADKKLATKEILKKAGLPFPKTLLTFSEFGDILRLEEQIHNYENFVIKPNMGRGGSGILVIGQRYKKGFRDINGNFLNITRIRKRIAEIIMGAYSYGMNDIALIEERIFPHHLFSEIYPDGLADIRIITYYKKPVMAMMRLPAARSEGKANLHQGGIGVSIDMESGITDNAFHMGKEIASHPDTGKNLIGLSIPYFHDLVRLCRKFPDDIKLNYLGFDFAIDVERGPLILEVNARPGLEIQNVNKKGLLNILRKIDKI